MCRCKVCSDVEGYNRLIKQLNEINESGDDVAICKGRNNILYQLDEYEAYCYSNGWTSVSVFLYNGGQTLDYEAYEVCEGDKYALRYFKYCPHCGRKLD